MNNETNIDTVGEIQRLCKKVDSGYDVDNVCNIIVRQKDDFTIYRNESGTLFLVNDAGKCTLYRIIS